MTTPATTQTTRTPRRTAVRFVIGLASATAVLTLTGCQLSTATTPSTTGGSSNPTTSAQESGTGTGGSAAGASPGKLRTQHTVQIEIEDLKLAVGACRVIIRSQADGTILPDPKCTPGAIDPAVTQANLDSTICRSGYTTTIRPPASMTDKFKKLALLAYGLDPLKTIEYDHLISLQLGGASTVSNLWPEPNRANAPGTTNPKDAVETHLNAAVCSHLVTLSQAQVAIARDWTTATSSLGLTDVAGKFCLAADHSRCASFQHGS